MNAIDILLDAASRPAEVAERLRGVSAGEANAFPGGHDNSISWLLWHTGREIDVQLSMLSGEPQVWERFASRLNLGSVGDGVGYGDSVEQARSVQVTEPEVLVDYVVESVEAFKSYVAGLSEASLDDVVDENWEPVVTRGVRLVSIVDDAAQHMGQAEYALGIVRKAA